MLALRSPAIGQRPGEDVAAFEWSLRAGTLAADIHAYAEAAGHHQRAVELWDRLAGAADQAGMDQVELLRRAAELWHLAGDRRHAAVLIKEGLRRLDRSADPLRAALLLERLSWYQILNEAMDEVLASPAEAVRLLADQPASAEHARVLGGYGRVLALASRFPAARRMLEPALAMARQVGAGPEQARVLAHLGGVQAWFGDDDVGVASLREACWLAVAHGDADALGPAFLNLGYTLAGLGRTEESVRVSLDGLAAAKAAGLDRHFGGFLLNNAAGGCLQLGRWDEAERLAEEAERLGHVFAAELTAEVALRRGRLSEAEAALDRGAGRSRPQDHGFDVGLLAELRLWQGRFEEAWRAVVDALPAVRDDTEVTGLLLWLAAWAEADRARRGRDLRVPEEVSAAVRHARELWRFAGTVRPHPLNPGSIGLVWPGVYRLMWDAELARLRGSATACRAVAARGAPLAGARRSVPGRLHAVARG